MLIMYEEDESEIEWQNINDIKKKDYISQKS